MTPRSYWRTLDEAARTPEFEAWLHREFPRGAAEWDTRLDRRTFLTLMGASVALAGLGGCASPPPERIVPYVRAPEDRVPGRPRWFATAFALDGIALGVLAESHEGRPVKLEGNPDHPASLGASDAFTQASVLDLYDPDRAQTPTERGRIRTWPDVLAALREVRDAQGRTGGAGFRLLTQPVTSPTLARQIDELVRAWPGARWHQWQPVARGDTVAAGARLAFGEVVEPRYLLMETDVVLALDADLLNCTPRTLRYARDFAERRAVVAGTAPMIRLYAVESSLTLTGGAADHRLSVPSRAVEGIARALARRLGLDVPAPAVPEAPDAWLDGLAGDLARHRGRSLVIAGDGQPAAVHALTHALNAALGNIGRTVVYTPPVEARPVDEPASLEALARDLAAGRVDTLVIVGGNPVYTAPADLGFGDLVARAPMSLHLSLVADETSARCRWHVPAAHYLEAWSDTRAWDGTVSIVQPLVAPLFGGHASHELLAALAGQPQASAHELVRATWRAAAGGEDFERWWHGVLRRGIVPETALRSRPVTLRSDWARALPAPSPRADDMEIVFRPDPTVYDGQFANNAWLQELPKPIMKLTWGNAALMAPATAARLGVKDEDVVELVHRGRRLEAPVLTVPGHADGSVTVHLGYGRWRAGRVGTGVGFNAYALRTSDAPWFAGGLTVHATAQREELARTQKHHMMHGRELVRSMTLAEVRAGRTPEDAKHTPPPHSLYPEYRYPGYAWGMAIDLTRCIGCNACVVACQAENNIPVVGKEQVLAGREMHWLRVDTYFAGDPAAPEVVSMPVPCMHCEKAPCEVVCPVAATVHSSEGLNDMIYNRCVGTRYCSNNCPYKVRRFNFFDYAEAGQTPFRLRANPDVTIRSRGVMEKCTYCVQRINAARIEADREGVRIPDGAVKTACQQACPTQAIVFGDINDRTTRVADLKHTPLNYALLAELNTQPRTTYLAAVRNPREAA